jgi:hypothetical protein
VRCIQTYNCPTSGEFELVLPVGANVVDVICEVVPELVCIVDPAQGNTQTRTFLIVAKGTPYNPGIHNYVGNVDYRGTYLFILEQSGGLS